MQQAWGGAAAAGSGQGPSTLMLLPQQQGTGPSSGPTAGLVLKFQVDGSRPSELLPGQDPAQAAGEAHVVFCRYLLGHKLAVDVWDGESLLQVSLTWPACVTTMVVDYGDRCLRQCWRQGEISVCSMTCTCHLNSPLSVYPRISKA